MCSSTSDIVGLLDTSPSLFCRPAFVTSPAATSHWAVTTCLWVVGIFGAQPRINCAVRRLARTTNSNAPMCGGRVMMLARTRTMRSPLSRPRPDPGRMPGAAGDARLGREQPLVRSTGASARRSGQLARRRLFPALRRSHVSPVASWVLPRVRSLRCATDPPCKCIAQHPARIGHVKTDPAECPDAAGPRHSGREVGLAGSPPGWIRAASHAPNGNFDEAVWRLLPGSAGRLRKVS